MAVPFQHPDDMVYHASFGSQTQSKAGPIKQKKHVAARHNRSNLIHVTSSSAGGASTEILKKRQEEEWSRIISRCYPDLPSKTYYQPPVHFNRVSYSDENFAETPVQILNPTEQFSDVRGDEAKRRIHATLRDVLHDKGPAFVVFSLAYDNYLNNAGKQHHGPDQGTSGSAERGHSERSPRGAPHTQTNGQGLGDSKLSPRSLPKVTTRPDPPQATPISAPLSMFPRPRDLEPNLQRGEFDVLILNRRVGVVLIEVKAIGDVFGVLPDLQSVRGQYTAINKRIKQALNQLQKGERVIKYLLNDLGLSGVHVTKRIMLPNLEKQTVLVAVMQDDQLVQKLCETLRARSLEEGLELCMFSEHLPKIGHSLDPDSDVIDKRWRSWWKGVEHEVSIQPQMTQEQYKSVVARFGGPATTQYVTTANQQKTEVTTLHQAVQVTSRCFTAPVLTPPQKDMLQDTSKRVYISAPPGTGKTVMLKIKAREWLSQNKDVFVLSLWEGSEAVSRLLCDEIRTDFWHRPESLHFLHSRRPFVYDLLKDRQRWSKTHQATQGWPAQPDAETRTQDANWEAAEPQAKDLKEESDLTMDCEMEVSTDNEPEIVRHGRHTGRDSRTGTGLFDHSPQPHVGSVFPLTLLSQTRSSLPHLIMAEAPWFLPLFLAELEQRLGKDGFVLWVASSVAVPLPRPLGFNTHRLSLCLRRPPVVVREMEKTDAYNTLVRPRYTAPDVGVLSSMPWPTDGPPVKRLDHRHHQQDHRHHQQAAPGGDVWQCQQCGEAVADFLTHQLQIGSDSLHGHTEGLHFSDVLISGHVSHMIDEATPSVTSTTTSSWDSALGDDDSIAWYSDSVVAQHADHTAGFLTGLKKGGVSFQIVHRGDKQAADRLALPTDKNRVQIAAPEQVLGLERPIVVVLETTDVRATQPRYVDPSFDVMACCTSQLVIVGGVTASLEDMFRDRLWLQDSHTNNR